MTSVHSKGRILLLVLLALCIVLVPILGFVVVPRLFNGSSTHHVSTTSGKSAAPTKWDGSIPAQAVKWSDPSTWDNHVVPDSGSAVTISAGRSVVLDVDPPQLKSITIEGTLQCPDRDLHLNVDWIMIHGNGRFQCGSEQSPYHKHAVITLTGNDITEDVMGMGTKLLGVMGGTLELHGDARVSWTHLAANAVPGTTQITLEKAVDWQSGDRIALASTDYDPLQAEEVTIQSVSNTTVSLSQPLKYMHWGQVQSISGQSMDERAEVGLLSHNIVVRGDDSSATTGFGGQIAIMHGSTAHIENVELFHMGQLKRLARYPLHWHLVGDADGSYAKNNSIDHSFNRCLTIHGTNNLQIQSNVTFDTIGHCFFMEDGVEHGNTLENNLGMLTRKPKDGMNVLPTDKRAATFWITNPNNTLQGNVAAGSQGIGFWYAFPEHPTGFSKSAANDLAVWPRRTPLGVFSGNVAHSNEDMGLNVDGGPKPDGTDEVTFYDPKQNPAANNSTSVVANFENFTAYKQRNLAVWLRGSHMTLSGAKLADNATGAIFASNNTYLQNSVLIGESNNKGNPKQNDKVGLDGRSLPQPYASQTPLIGYAFYDGLVGAEHNTFINYQANSQRPAGALGYNRNNNFPINVMNFAQDLHFVNANQVYLENPHDDKDGDKAALFLDADGSVTGHAGNYVVTNNPFLVDGSCSSQSSWNTNICSSHYAGLAISNDNGQGIDPITLNRNDGVSTSLVGVPNNPKEAHISALTNRSYTVKLNGSTPQKMRFFFNNLNQGDWMILSLPYSNSSINVYRDYYVGNKVNGVNSVSDLQASGDNAYFFDSGSNTLYIKAVGHAKPGDNNNNVSLFVDPR